MNKENFPFDVAPRLVTDFVKAFVPFTEAPDEFLAAVPLFVGGVIASRWYIFNQQFLNNYYLLAGPTGKVKKSTTLNLSTKLVRDVKNRNPFQQFQILKSLKEAKEDEPPVGPLTAYPLVTHFSVEGLQSHAIGDGTSTAIQMGEYGTLFDVGKRQAQQNTISELTNMYDGQPIEVTNVSRRLSAENFSISLLAASTEAWLNEFCTGRNIGGGFVNRHLVFRGESTRTIPVPTPPPSSHWNSLVEQFSSLMPKDIHFVLENKTIKWVGPITHLAWCPEAEFGWKEYYRARTQQIRSLVMPILAEISARELVHATKIAGLGAFLDQRTRITRRDLEFGIRLARWSIQNTITLTLGQSRSHSWGEAAERVISKLRKSGPMSKADLARSMGGSQKEINRAIHHLLIDEVLEHCPDNLLRITGDAPNSQFQEIQKYFGKTDTSEFLKKRQLGVGGDNVGDFDEERAAILEFDAGYPRNFAEQEAARVSEDRGSYDTQQ